MSKEIKNENVNPKTEEQANATANQDEKATKEPGKVKCFFMKHGGKIKAGAAIAGAVCAGVVADRLGIKLAGSGKKKQDDISPADPE